MEAQFTIWNEKSIREEALKYKSKNDFRKFSHKTYQAAHGRGILDDVCQHMTSRRTTHWTDNMIAELASRYTSRGEFKRKSNFAYQIVIKRRIFDDICIHMKSSPLDETTNYVRNKVENKRVNHKHKRY